MSDEAKVSAAGGHVYPDGESFLAGLDDLGDCTPDEAVEAACGHRIVLKGSDLVIACTRNHHGAPVPHHGADVQIAGGGTARVEWSEDA